MSSVVEDICELLDSYNGRDKVVRLACYSCKLYGCLRGEKPWQTAGSRLSGARLMLRLFDDVPMIRHTYNYGLGRHPANPHWSSVVGLSSNSRSPMRVEACAQQWDTETSFHLHHFITELQETESTKIAAILGVLANVVDQTFLPVEKACWLHEVGVLRLAPRTAHRLEVFSTALWAASLYISLIQTLRSIRHIWWSRDCLRAEAASDARRSLDARLLLQTVTAGKLCLDIAHAVSCLPPGWLWGERIGATRVSAIATLSSLVGIGLYFARKRLLK